MAVPKAFVKCVNEIKAVAPDVFDDNQAVEILKRLDERFKEKKAAAQGQAAEKIILDEAKKMAGENVLAIQIAKRNHAINVGIKYKIKNYLSNFKDPVEGLEAYLGGINKVRGGARLSVDAQGKGIMLGYLGGMANSLDKEGLWEVFASGKLDNEIAAEMWEIRDGGNPGVSGSTEAKKIAGIIQKTQIDLVNRQNNAGAFIKARPGYIVRQSHDMIKIRRAGFESWKQTILPLLDHDATFGTGDPEKILRGAYDALGSGIHHRAQGADQGDSGGHLFGFHGPANVAKKASQNRVLHFNSADSFMKYNADFGTKNLREAVLAGVEHGSRNVALMENLGTNPLALFEGIVSDLLKENKGNFEVIDKLRGSRLTNLFKVIDGTTRIPVNPHSARIANGIRMLQTMSKLGGAVISSISDIPTIASELRYQGKGIFESYGEAVGGLFRGRGSEEQKEVARLIGVGLEGMMGDIHGRFNTDDSVAGKAARLTQTFFKWNGLSWWTDTMRTTTALVMSNHLAEQAGKAINDLDADTRRIFGLYNIGESEWNIFRKTMFEGETGYKYLTPDKLDNIDRADIEQLIKDRKGIVNDRNVQRELDRIKTQFQTYFQDRADFAVPQPGANEQATLTMGSRPGTVLGEVTRFVAQFKGFPLAVLMRPVAREVYGKGAESIGEALKNGNGEMSSLVHLMVATTVFGYMAGVAKDILRGKTPRDPKNPKVLLAALAQGGGFGIYGDFLFGEFSRYGRSALSTAAGPVLGQVDDIAEIYTKLRTGDDAVAQIFRTALNNTPYANLFYTRTALDYLFLYQLQESINPGYLRRMEARAESESGQEFMFPPSQIVR
jgi:hypothetical protein